MVPFAELLVWVVSLSVNDSVRVRVYLLEVCDAALRAVFWMSFANECSDSEEEPEKFSPRFTALIGTLREKPPFSDEELVISDRSSRSIDSANSVCCAAVLSAVELSVRACVTVVWREEDVATACCSLGARQTLLTTGPYSSECHCRPYDSDSRIKSLGKRVGMSAGSGREKTQ